MAYSAKDITVLKGLEPVRERPGMYIGSTGLTGLHHLVYEVVDNAVDEAMAGEATRIDVTLLADGGCRVTDNGRGIPVDPHPEDKRKSAAEIVMTTLHAGGKFGGEGYKISGGLHGVGVSVVNALSIRLELEIHRDGGKWTQTYAKGGQPQGKLTKVAASKKQRDHGHLLAGPGDLRRGRVPLADAHGAAPRDGVPEQGPRDPLPRRAGRPRARADLQVHRRHRRLRQAPQRVQGAVVPAGRRRSRKSGDGYDVDIAMQWNTGYYEGIHSFANNIATTEGGMHEEGFKKALTNVVNRYAKGKNLLKDKDANLLGEDIREGLTAIVSVKLRNPQFEGQTKAKLGNTEMRSLVEKATNEKLAEWLEEHPSEGRAAVQKSPAGIAGPARRPPGA